MRTRDVTIPLGLWICAAICAHFVLSTGGLVVAKMHDDRSELWKLSREASSLAKMQDQTFEVALSDSNDDKKDESASPPPPEPPVAQPPAPKAELPPKPQEKPQEKKPPKPEERRVIVIKKDEEKKPAVMPEDPLKDRRIAVRQHAKANQEDNPNAKFIADEANHVAEETVATQTSHDRDDQNPTPGGNHPGADKQPGDSDKTRIAESEEHAGEKNRAPGERGTDFDVVHEPKLPPRDLQAQQLPRPPQTAAANSPPPLAAARAASPPPSSAPGGAAPASPEVQTAPGGDWSFHPPTPGGAPGSKPSPANPSAPGGKLYQIAGLGRTSAPGTMNINLNANQVASIVGADNLRRLREADGERRKSEHRGSWVASGFERWRSAIENYISSVKPGNQTSLNTAAVPFASYLNGMHNRIHPIFADAFLESLDTLPQGHPLNDSHLVTRLEIVLTKEGHLKKMGIVKTSGITAFDIAALDSVDRAQPFGPAPGAIVSPDGNVYLHWEFHRDEVYACSTIGARPFILNNQPKPEEQPPAAPTPTSPTRERGAPPGGPGDLREGALGPALFPSVARSRP